MRRADQRRIATIALAILASAHAAAGQTTAWRDRGYVQVSGVLQPSASASSTVKPLDFVEPSVVDTSYKPGSIPGIDAGAGVRVWRNLAVGIDVSWVSKTTTAAVSAQVPHPFFFNRPRAVSGDASGLDRDETALHVQALWVMPMRRRWQLALAGGPSWFTVGQDVVSDVTITQTYPYDTATFATALVAHRSRSGVGFNAGADATYRLRRHVGVGAGLMFSHASVPLDDTLTVDAGGVRVSGGLRFRF
jgi:outer membrane protein with beta-barrel domain